MKVASFYFFNYLFTKSSFDCTIIMSDQKFITYIQEEFMLNYTNRTISLICQAAWYWNCIQH